MRWIPEYATGFPRLDEQHRMLFKMSEDFRAALDDGGGARIYDVILSSMAFYAQAHFGMEEQCMEQCRCRAAAANRHAHARFLEEIGAYRQRYDAGGFDRDDAYGLVNFLDAWLHQHIGGIDVQLKDCV